MDNRVIFLQPTALRRKIEHFNHLLPAVLLIVGGYEALAGETHERMLSPWLNISVGIVLLFSVVYEMRKKKNGHDRFVNWMDIVAGLVLLTEGVNMYHPNKIFQPAYGYLLVGVFTIGKGIFHTKFPHGRKIVFRDDGFSARTSPFVRVRLSWENVSSITIDPTSIRFTIQKNRSRTLGLRRVENRNEVISAFVKQAQSLGIAITDRAAVTA